MKSFGSSASGLQCSWGSDLDTQIPRPKMPKSALPDSVRKNLGLSERKSSKRFSEKFEVDSAVHLTKGGQEAKQFLKMKSGVPMSTRTSGLVKMQGGYEHVTAMKQHMNSNAGSSSGYSKGGGMDAYRQQPQKGQLVPKVVRRRSSNGAGMTNDNNVRNSIKTHSNTVGLGEIENIPNPNNRRRSIEDARKNSANVGSWR